MEKIHYWDPKCGWYYTANTNCIDLFPSELEKLAEVTASDKFCVIDTWHGMFIFDIRDAGDMWTIHITKCEGRFELTTEIVKSLAIHVLFRKNGVSINPINLPWHLNDKVAWALGARKYQKMHNLEALEEYYRTNYMDYQTMLEHEEIQPGPCYAVQKVHYGKCTAVVVNNGRGDIYDGRYFIDGFLTRDEAITILKRAIDLNGWYFSYPAKIQYVLDNI